MLIREMHLRALDTRVSNAVLGISDQSVRSRDVVGWFSSLGARYRRFYAEENIEELRTILQAAGFNHHRVLPIWIGVKIFSMFACPIVAFLVAQVLDANVLVFTLVGLVLGIMGPRLIMLVLKRRFDAAIRLGMPDAIDLLVVCSEAGMGLESALQRVAAEIVQTNPPMARVLTDLLDDLRVLPNRFDAFEKMGARSEGLRRFGTMISQSLQYGTPLSQALRSIAADLRRERITKLEEKAHKLGAKLTVPMVLFLLPAMFVILGGGPMLNLIKAFK
ncbi:type II secretion system F family protein [Bradyrhizobium elkanii]|uniref:type II secretion system F family protein n=2 Tax=Nitrobacteraceae TaxID=41294 RepID=UPI00216A0043|nr:type II secretion system F family protein [Bradyrhizobium elkanii]MCS3517977.1 tight adherence protein C [Bradyrhizobium elkanii]MCS4074532.1 tight adherence protein C [Bradyrhizobium elkanii]MCS4081169.1 tight adherence protein C [Bradyrhizobium elkanii]MCW2129251.1 tight adherence protein C [Bradyrhizobium elkanii]MCW2166928.1 tight adherence protein C [Bradyrhizobium elkanii]